LAREGAKVESLGLEELEELAEVKERPLDLPEKPKKVEGRMDLNRAGPSNLPRRTKGA
jgi:hypothetical protein